MQDISKLPEIDLDRYLQKLKDKPIDEEELKYKAHRLFSIGYCNEKQYMGDVQDVYAWMLLCNRKISFRELIPNEKLQKLFAGEFLISCVKHLIACKKFQLNQMMLVTEQFFVECIIFFNNHFAEIDKYPTLASLPGAILRKDRLFYKQNAITDYPHLVVQPNPSQVIANNTFIDSLQEGDIVQCIKVQKHGNRLAWSRAAVKKITSISVYVVFLNDKSTTSRNIDKSSYEIVPLDTYTKDDYDWRLNLKIGDKVDYESSRGWITTQIEQIKTITFETRQIFELKLKTEDLNQNYDNWAISTSCKIQKPGLIMTEQFGYNNTLYHYDTGSDDFNDLILDQQNKGKHLIIRQDVMKSLLYIDLANLFDQFGIFQKILDSTKEKKIGVEVCAQLASFISAINPMFHRSFAVKYLKQYSNALLNFIKQLDQNNIRNLSKQRLTDIMIALNEFLSKLLPVQDKKGIIQQLQLSLALRFINSDFLQRKMQAVTIFTDLLKQSSNHHFHQSLSIKTMELLEWFEKNDIIQKIFNQKSHPQLISRGTDFLQTYLIEQQNPTSKSFDALLEYTQPLLKLNNELFDHLPSHLKQKLVQKISQKKGVTNKDALEIMRRFGGNQIWFLQNGGELWVDVIRGKKKRTPQDIAEVFNQPFDVVLKITQQISKIYDGRLKNQFFKVLVEGQYLEQIFKIDAPLADKINFLKIVLDNLLQLSEQLFSDFVNLWDENSQTNLPEFYELYELFVSKLSQDQLKLFFQKFFQNEQKLLTINKGGFKIFSQGFIKINELLSHIQKQITQYYTDTYPARREQKQTITITVNPIKLQGMNNLMFIVFQSKSSEVIQIALNFISHLFNHLSPSLSDSIATFKDNFLQQCLQKLYISKDPSKYLQIIKSILDQSQINGNGNLPSIEDALPGQKITYTIVDCFSVIKRKFQIQVESSLTVFELRFLLGKQVGAFVNELSLSVDKKPIIDMLNGYTLRQANLGQPIVIQRKGKIQKVNLTDRQGKLTEDAKAVFKKIFNGYSTNSLMSKPQCLKFYQKCVGQNSTYSAQGKVDKIFDAHDSNKDGYLQLQEFLDFYENSARSRQSVVWSNLQSFGIRADLKILDDLKITHVDSTILIRHLLVNNHKFMDLLLRSLQSNNQQDRTNSWKLLQRLPLCINTTYQLNLKNTFHLKYWLYLIDAQNKQFQITKEILQTICNSDAETLAIGLKSAVQTQSFDLSVFEKLINKLNEINKKVDLSVFEKVSLDYALNLIVKCLNNDESVKKEFIQHTKKYLQLFLSGLLSENQNVRQKYVEAIWNILEHSCEHNFKIFEPLFNHIYRYFETSTKSGLYPQFFEIFSRTLELIRNKQNVLKSLNLNWTALTRSVIERFKTHKCTEERLSSPPDWVVQGFMHILSRLLDEKTAQQLEELIPYLFQTLLFPEGGTNKLKTATTRKQAYELIYTICKYNPNSLEKLFKSGFTKVYKTVSNTKAQSSSYLYSFYNDVRSDTGYAGVRNLGCICYMIAMIQQFYMTKPLRYLLLMADDKQPQCLVKKGLKEIDDNILHQFQTMFANLELTQRQQYNPEEFCFTFKDIDGNPVNVSIQQDAQQFLNVLFDRLEQRLSQTPFKNILQSIYGGINCSQLICNSCKNIKQSDEHYFNISLQIKGFKNYDQSFKKFIQGQEISGYTCDFCKQKSQVTKRSLLHQLPNYLIIHMQRICFNYQKFQNQKINSRWQFPHQLNVYDYTIDKERNQPNSEHYQYTLKGIVVHIGSADYGHYFSYIKTSSTQWLEFNDERVRQFDPDDIQNQCFGGQHWRRENQSAYLLVYQKKIKKQIKFQFESKEQMQTMKLNLQLPLVEQIIQQSKTSDQKQEKQQVQVKQKQQNKPAIVGVLDIQKVPYFVSQKLVAKINKSNEQFSMTLNVSNNEFAYFIYKILSIQPPESLKGQFLELCHQCFHFKMQLQNDESLSDWMVKRFKQLIVGSGWNFYDQATKAWLKDIISSERTTRIAVKNVLVSVLADIITPQLITAAEQDTQDEQQHQLLSDQVNLDQPRHVKIINFLNKAFNMIDHEVRKQWQRFQEYFEFWYELLSSNRLLLKYAQSKNMVQILLDFVLQDQSPFNRKHEYGSIITKYNKASFHYVLEIVGLLLQEGYNLSDQQQKCLHNLAYLDKLIIFHPYKTNLVERSCKNNPVNTQRLAYLILYYTNKITHSNEVKAIMNITSYFLLIQDDLKARRIEWLIGYPQYVYSEKSDSFGQYAISNLVDQRIIKYRSGLRLDSFLELLQINREKFEHIGCRLATLLLELQQAGYINLSLVESPFTMNKSYISWLPRFAKKYYDEYKNHSTDYTVYGERIYELTNNRQQTQNTQPTYLIGKTVQKSQVFKKQIQGIVVQLQKYTVPLVISKPTEEKNESIPPDLISYRSGIVSGSKATKKYLGCQKFLSSSTISRSNFDSYQLDQSQKNSINPFENPIISDYIYKFTFKNTTEYTQIIIITFQKTENVKLPLCPISFQIQSKRQQFFSAHKILVEQPMPQIKYSISVFKKEEEDKYGKKKTSQLITPVKDTDGIDINSDEENHFSY